MKSLIKYLNLYIKRNTLITITSSFLLLIVLNDSFAQNNPSLKPLSTLNCQNNGRIIFEVYPVESPYVMNVTRRNWMGYFNNVTTGILLGGVGGGVSNLTNIDIDDQTNEFKQSVSDVLTKIDLQKLFLEILECNFKSKTSCKTLCLTTQARRDSLLMPSDQLVIIGLYFGYQGGRPKIMTMMGVTVITKNTDIKQFDLKSDSLMKLAEEIKAISPKKLMKSGKVRELQKASEHFMGYLDSGQTFTISSPSHPVKDWLANDGYIIKQELEAVMNQLAIELENKLFQ